MPFDVSGREQYGFVVLAVTWLACSWTLYRFFADLPVHQRGPFSRTLPRRTILVLGGLLTMYVGFVVFLVGAGILLVVAALCTAYDHVISYFTKGPGSPFVISTRERFRRFVNNAPA